MWQRSGASRVLVFTRQVLPYSQTFIREQTLALRGWWPWLVGLEPVSGVDPAPLEHFTLEPRPPRGRRALALHLRDWLWAANAEHEAQLRSRPALLIHAHFGTSAVWVWPLAQRLGLPLLVTLHGYDITVRPDWWQEGHGGRLHRRYPDRLRTLAHGGARFVAVSQGIRASAIRYGLPPERVVVHYIGVDIRRFQRQGPPIAQRPPRIVFAGRLVEKKGCEFLLRAAARLRDSLPQVELIIIGEGPLRPALEREARELGVNARFMGALDHDAVRLHLDAARVVCVPSVEAANGDAEGLPMIVLEAAAMGVPVVTSARLQSGEGIIDGRTGFLCSERDPEALALRLRQILTDNSLASRMSAAGVSLVRERFELAACTRSLEGLYDEVVRESSCVSAGEAAHSA